MTEPDVVVIGGGPAGLAAAIVCATHGLATTLIERYAVPISKPCGEGLLPNGVRALDRIGIDVRSLAAHARTIAGIRYHTSQGRTAEASFDGSACLGIRRIDLMRILYAHARALPYLEVICGQVATAAIDGGRPLVHMGSMTWRPKLAIGADGLLSRTRDAVGVVVKHHRRSRWGCRQHFDGEPWTDRVEVYFERGLEAYVTPLQHGVNVAVLWDARVVRIPTGRSPVTWLIAQAPALERRLVGRTQLDRAQGRGPFDLRVRRPWRAGVLLMGDAAGYFDPLTGEGVGLAFEQAALLSSTVIPALQCTPLGQVIDPMALAQFAQAANRHARPNRQLTNLLLRIARHPAMVEWIVARLAAHPALFAHLLDVNMGHRELWQFSPLVLGARTLFDRGYTARASFRAVIDSDRAPEDREFNENARQEPQQLELEAWR
jgi:2-polyprenyl-6-methoxyphenol hydroxylase-like FAD-dependent oxidoreductase